MPSKRSSGRPLRPPSVTPSSRTPLHTQELMLFSSPISASPARRSKPTSKRSGSSHAAGANQAGHSRGFAQHRQVPFPIAARGSTDRTPVEYEPLPEHYHAAPSSSSTTFSSSIPAVARGSGSGSGIPLPPSLRQTPPANGARLAATATSSAAPVGASGAGSRVIRLLRDARAAVRDPIRPETPLEAFAAPPSLSTGASANVLGRDSTSAAFFARCRGGLESRSKRRLPAGWRLTPMIPPSSVSESSSSAALKMAEGSTVASSAISVVRDAMSSSTDFFSSLPSPPPLPPTGTLELPGHISAAKDANNMHVRQSSVVARNHGIDAQEFGQLYLVVQQAGNSSVAQSFDLLQLKQRLVTSLHSTGKPPTLDRVTVEWLQSTLRDFCRYWPTGATLRQAVDHYYFENSNTAEFDSAEGSRASASANTTFAPLLYTQRAFLAASITLQSFPVAALVAELISFEATVHTLHVIAEAGLAEWVARETTVLAVLVEILRLLAGAEFCSQLQALQWIKWILSTLSLCCKDAVDAATIAPHVTPLGADNPGVSRRPQRLQSSGSSSYRSLPLSDYWETDVIRGSGFVDDEAENQLRNTQNLQQASCVKSASLRPKFSSSHPSPHLVNSVPFADAMPAGSPLSFAQSEAGGAAASALAPILPCSAPEEHESLRARLVSLGFLPTLQEISKNALAHCASLSDCQAGSPAADTLASLLPIIGTFYRCFAERYPEELQGLDVLGTLTSMLNTCAADAATVEAASRALVKLTYVDEYLAEMQAGTAVITAAAHALRSQLSRSQADTSQESSIELLVSRLCGVIARVAENNPEQQEYLVSAPMVDLLETLSIRYVTVSDSAGVELDQFAASLPLPPIPVLQAVVWVLGIASMSPRCPLQLVRSVTQPLVHLLEILRRKPNMQLTAVYVLMCLSNLSYFFGAFEYAERARSEDERGVASDWLSSLYSSLGLQLAHYLFEDNVEATVEATRILGNISYTNAGRDWMEANHCDEVIVLFLGHEDLRVVYNCYGVLLNLTAASPCRIVQEPELLHMMLSYTSRYTDQDRVEAVTTLEEVRLRQQLQQRQCDGDVQELMSEAKSHATQIADVVEKLLLNVNGVLTASTI
ncbi:hypothetical protein Q4I32_007087 [Leishmania shawi]|uniref:Uncharacterized protein n=1 Tax=Leishmania shawi TaxID=5680 RepID=A0AAW3BCD1_9TRYP